MDDLISVIVPVYNVEKYLCKCVDSVINQTYKNLEIILVDDGSPDSCGKICNKYANKDARVKVIHKENGGLSDARNIGIDAAKGEYLAFIDSDDYIAPEMIETLYNYISRDGSDMALCNFTYVDEKFIEIKDRNSDSPIQNELISGEEALKKLTERKSWYYVVAWNKLYKRCLFEKIKFPKGKVNEDEFVVHHIFYKCNTISCVKNSFYFYVQREGSIMSAASKLKKMDAVEAFYDRVIFASENGFNNIVFSSVCVMAEKLSNFTPCDEISAQRKKELYNMYIQSSRLIKTKGLSLKRKVVVYLNRISPAFLIFVKKET